MYPKRGVVEELHFNLINWVILLCTLELRGLPGAAYSVVSAERSDVSLQL